ncbi:MAG: AraC family transcriptional regulator [Eubacteriales bacterium]|nr:AraC family transcriptional regulator [Eubacteriales bacterium]
MKEQSRQMLVQFGSLLHVGICGEKEGVPETLSTHLNPVMKNEELLEKLRIGAKKQSTPFIMIDEFQVCFASLRFEGEYFFFGPMALEKLKGVEAHRFYNYYQIKGEEPGIRHFSYQDLLKAVSTFYYLVTGEIVQEDTLIKTGKMQDPEKEKHIENAKEKEKLLFAYTYTEEISHHTYQEERELLSCVREGKIKEALEYSANMDVSLGRMAKKEINHWRYTAIAAITLCTRAAIEGGVSPATAYQLSDFYIQRLDEAKDITAIVEVRNQAMEDLTEHVVKRKSRKSNSNYTERTKEYMAIHYREKIYIGDIAEKLGLSESYLSRLFHKETGIRMQDYLVNIRLECAVNLLLYSEESISRIAEYVNFPSQSYFGKIFKEKYQMSPKQYRSQFKPKGF